MNLRIFCQRQPWELGSIAVWIRTRPSPQDSMGNKGIAQPLQFRMLTEADAGVETQPAMTLTPEDAQQFIDELWNAGLRPTEGTGSAGALAAVTRHLEDMRTLVFKSNNSPLPPRRE